MIDTYQTLTLSGVGTFGVLVGLAACRLFHRPTTEQPPTEQPPTEPDPVRSPHVAAWERPSPGVRSYGPHPAPAVIGAIVDQPAQVMQHARRPVPDVNKHVLDERLWKTPDTDGKRWKAGVVHTTAVPAVEPTS